MGPMDSAVGVAFWVFLAIATIGSFWREFAIRREREMTIRKLIEREQQLDSVLISKMLQHQTRIAPDGLLVGGAVALAVGVGLPTMGYFVGFVSETSPFYPLLGVGCLAAAFGVALLAVGQMLRRRANESKPKPEPFPRS